MSVRRMGKLDWGLVSVIGGLEECWYIHDLLKYEFDIEFDSMMEW